MNPGVTEEGRAGLIQGDLFGLFDPPDVEGDGYWIGESLGTFQQMAEGLGINPSDFLDYPEAYLETLLFVGTGLGEFEDGGVLDVIGGGASLNLFGQDWGIWGAGLIGTYEGETSPFRLAVGGEADWGAWLGTIAGEWEDPGESVGELSGEVKGIWVSETVEGDLATGPFTGDVIGTNDAEGTWQAVGVGDWVEIAVLDAVAVGYDLDELTTFVSIPITEVYASLLDVAGSFNGGVGAITGAMDASFYGNADPATSGIWAALIEGSYTEMPPAPEAAAPWEATFTPPSELGDIGHLHGTEWSNGQWLADVHIHDVTETLTSATGQAGGTYNPTDASSGTFEGVGTGTWSEPAP